ncbi:uncharacterized protein LOC141902874 isoform X2 [Tubulanus polymorphus]|uniref:uncharacterized protein LOC141902874 isoform X2 n=1 Tax=Tubulanus polymorphus TaxID=672921 RepID=UPI003DA21FEB
MSILSTKDFDDDDNLLPSEKWKRRVRAKRTMRLTSSTTRDRSRSRSVTKTSSHDRRSRSRSRPTENKHNRSRSRSQESSRRGRSDEKAIKKESEGSSSSSTADRIKKEPGSDSHSRTSSPRSSSSSTRESRNCQSSSSRQSPSYGSRRTTLSPTHRSGRYHERRTHSPRCPQSSRYHHHHHRHRTSSGGTRSGDKPDNNGKLVASTSTVVTKPTTGNDDADNNAKQVDNNIDLYKIIENYRSQTQQGSTVTSPLSSGQRSFDASPTTARLADNNNIAMAYNTEILSDDSLESSSSNCLSDNIKLDLTTETSSNNSKQPVTTASTERCHSDERSQRQTSLPIVAASNKSSEISLSPWQRVTSASCAAEIVPAAKSGDRQSFEINGNEKDSVRVNGVTVSETNDSKSSSALSHNLNIPKDTAKPAENGLQHQKRETVTTKTIPYVNGNAKTVSEEGLQSIMMKKRQIEKAYKQDCETFATVVKMLVSKDSRLEESIEYSLRENLRDIGQRCVKELQDYVDKVKQKDACQNHQ